MSTGEGKYPQFEALDSQTLEIRRRVLGSEHPDTLKSMQNLALAYENEGKYPQAQVLFRQTLESHAPRAGPRASRHGVVHEWAGRHLHRTNVGWSADGKWLVVGTYSPLSNPTGSGPKEIRLMDLKTHKTTTLAGSGGLYSPRWSPDGRYIAALRSGPETLWLYDLSSQKWSELQKSCRLATLVDLLTRNTFTLTLPCGAPLAFYRVGISSHKLEMVASLKDFKGFAGWTGLAPDDSPLVLRDIGTQEIYAIDWEAP